MTQLRLTFTQPRPPRDIWTRLGEYMLGAPEPRELAVAAIADKHRAGVRALSGAAGVVEIGEGA